MTGNRPARNHEHYVVIHGHFYQPPRENPWLGSIEQQTSALPAHDWNERVYDECYRPNAHSRLLDSKGMIQSIYNNYRSMSFNFGPTLMSWLVKQHPDCARQIADADRESVTRLGHGNAIAQVYNHIIMPLASPRDQITQIRWTKSSFVHFFGREPEGIWLAETAINRTTARILIDEGFRFTVLSPNQAESFRHLDGGDFVNTAQHPIDTRKSYRFFPDEGNRSRFLDIFFFDEGLSKAVSFGDLLTSSDRLAGHLHGCFAHNSPDPQAVIIATDGETFGHHKAFGDMCLAHMFTHTADPQDLIPVNFAYLLDKQPSRWEVRLKNADGEGCSWSCAHGTGRWIRDCGCSTGGKTGWNQQWRGSLRDALNYMQREIDLRYEKALAKLFKDPWAVRNAYEPLMEELSFDTARAHLEKLSPTISLGIPDILLLRRLLEAQKFMLYSFTSCGWFFNDITGIETVQNLAYACRALTLGIEPEAQGVIESKFLEILGNARSNEPGITGRSVYEKQIKPYVRHAEILAFTAAVQHVLFDGDLQKVYCGYLLRIDIMAKFKQGEAQYHAFGISVDHPISAESGRYAVLVESYGGTGLSGWVLPLAAVEAKAFNVKSVADWSHHAQSWPVGLNALFDDTKLDLAEFMLNNVASSTVTRYASWVSGHERELDSLVAIMGTLPPVLSGPVAYVLSTRWDAAVARLEKKGSEDKVLEELLSIDKQVKRFGITLDFTHSRATLEKLLFGRVAALCSQVTVDECDKVRYLLNIVDRFKIAIPKHRLEDMFYPVHQRVMHELYERYVSQNKKNTELRSLLLHILEFARRMNFNTDDFPMEEPTK